MLKRSFACQLFDNCGHYFSQSHHCFVSVDSKESNTYIVIVYDALFIKDYEHTQQPQDQMPHNSNYE